MKSLRFMLTVVALLALSSASFAQAAQPAQPVPPEGKAAYEKLKSLAGAWEGTLTTVPVEPSVEGMTAKVWLRVTSRGNAIVHELKPSGIPDNPITMLYLEGERLMLTHYCDAGNRPRMEARLSPDGKTVEFDFLDVGNYSPKQGGHMQHARFITIDEDHHVEEWTFRLEGRPAVVARFDLRRVKQPPL